MKSTNILQNKSINNNKIKDLDVTRQLLDKHNSILKSSHMSDTKSEYSIKSDKSTKSKIKSMTKYIDLKDLNK